LTDCDDTTGWNANHSADPLTSLSLAVVYGDQFRIIGTCDAAADEYVYYEKDIPDILSNTYSKYLLRWRTGNSSAGLGAKAQIYFSDLTTQTILGDPNPEYSTTWQIASGTVTADKTIGSLRLWADDYPNSVAAGESHVYYDFFLLYKAPFTLPNIAGGMNIDFPPREAILQPPGRDVNITQNLGTESAVVNIGCDLDQNTWKRSGDTIDGQVFLDILHNRSSEPWQWLDTGSHQFKVSVHPTFRWLNNGDGSTSRLLDLVLKEYSLGDKSNETYLERYGIGL